MDGAGFQQDRPAAPFDDDLAAVAKGDENIVIAIAEQGLGARSDGAVRPAHAQFQARQAPKIEIEADLMVAHGFNVEPQDLPAKDFAHQFGAP
jgi:hypothetical protein